MSIEWSSRVESEGTDSGWKVRSDPIRGEDIEGYRET